MFEEEVFICSICGKEFASEKIKVVECKALVHLIFRHPKAFITRIVEYYKNGKNGGE